MGPKIANKCSNKRGNLEIIIGTFFGRIQKRICDPRSYGFFTTKKKTENQKKKNHLPRQRHVLVPLVMRKIKGKNNKSIVAAKTRRKSNINYV